MEQEQREGFDTDEWIHANPAEYHLAEEYNTLVFPKLKEIEKLCQELGMPFFMRFFIEQTPDGNRSGTVSWLGGPDKATPEILALTMLDQLSQDTPMQMAALFGAAVQKFSGEDAAPGIFMP